MLHTHVRIGAKTESGNRVVEQRVEDGRLPVFHRFRRDGFEFNGGWGPIGGPYESVGERESDGAYVMLFSCRDVCLFADEQATR